MKQIPFNPELIGKPGIVCKVDGEVPDFIKFYPDREYPVVYVPQDGSRNGVYFTDIRLEMFRQTRSAEDIAKDAYAKLTEKHGGYCKWSEWDRLPSISKEFNTALVQAGIDEVTDKNE